MSEEHWFLNGKKVMKQQMLSKQNQQIIDGISVTLEASFGCLQLPIRMNCMFVNDDTLMFISGKHIVLYDIIRKRQTYIMKSAEDEQVNGLNYYNASKLLIAIAFKSTNKILPTVKVYNRKKKRFYQCVHSHLLPNTKVFEILFIRNGKNLITMSQSEDGYGLSLFAISKEVSITFHPIKFKISLLEAINELEFYVIGPTYFALYKFQLDINGLEMMNNLLEILNLEEDEKIVGCTYNIEKKITIIATSKNNLILLQGDKIISKGEVQTQVQQQTSLLQQLNKEKNKIPESQQLVNFNISTITKTQKGFIIGFIGKPALQVYEIEENEIILIGTYFIKDEHIYGIHQIHLAADEMYAALTVVYFNRTAYQVQKDTLPSQQVLTCEQILENYSGKLELFTFNLAIVEALKTVQKDPFEPLFEKGVHKGPIYNTATTPMRSLMASVCEDKNIKFWDYTNDFKELFSHQFHEIPLSVALNPLSYQCAIGFKDGLRFYFILDDDLKPVHTETTKACNSLCYSEGGHLLAAANANQIQLYNPLTYQMFQVLPNHQANIKDLLFVEKDNMLISQCTYGILYVWNLLTGEKFVEHAQKQNKYHCVYYDYDFDLVVGVSDQRLKVYNEKGQNLALEVDTSPTQFSAICVSHRYNAIFFGTTQGSVRVYSYPFYHFNPKTMEYIEIPVHQLSVTSIRVSPDNSYLITSSVDGSIFFSKIKQFINGEEISQLDLISKGDLESKVTSTFALNNLCLCSKSTLENRKDQLKELEYRLQNFKSDIDDAKEVLLNNNDQLLAEQKDQNQQQVHIVREQISQTIQSSDMKISKLKLDTIELRKQSKKQIEQMEEDHSQKLLTLYKVRDDLNDKLVSVKHQQDEQKRMVMQEYQQSINQVDDEYCQKYQDLYQRFSEAMNNMKLDQRKFKEVLQQSEKDYETYYKESQESLQQKLQQHTEHTINMRAHISKFKKENGRLIHRNEFLSGLIKDTEDQVDGLERELLAYQEKHRNMLTDLREKEKLINQREQQIKDFRMKNVHLQNFQKVYDYRVNTLKDEREPLMDHLKNMEKHVKNLYNELIEESGLKQQRKEEKSKLKGDLRILQTQLKSALTVLSLSQRKMENFRHSLQQLLISDTSNWKVGLSELHHSLSSENQKAINIKNPVFQETLKDMQKDPIQQQIDQSQQTAIYKELSSQKQFLTKKLTDVETAVNYQLGERQDAYYTIQGMNEDLIKQCTALREKKQRLKEYIEKQNKAYREIKRELSSQGVEIHEEDPNRPQATQFSKTHATGFTGITRTPGTQSQQNFRTKIIKNLQ